MKTIPRTGTQLKRSQSIGASVLLCLSTMTNGWAQDHWIIHHFTGPDGAAPISLVLSGATFFGTTMSGGISNRGTVFRLNTNGSDFTMLKEFTGSDGAEPRSLMLSDTTLYGTTVSGGLSNLGTLFKLNTDGSGFAVLKEFTGGDGASPSSCLVLSGALLYGTTHSGGLSNRGTVFKLNTDGGGFAVIKDFTDLPQGGAGADGGCLPSGDLALTGTTLYGATGGGGIAGVGAGVVYKVSTDGSGYTVLKQGDFDDGGRFQTGVILSGTTLYGTTLWGRLGAGAVFKLNTDGSGYRVLKWFNVYDGMWPNSLALSGSKLFGTAPQANSGVVFMLDTEGSHFSLLKRFNGSDGSGPRGLVMAGPTLYGTTASGGDSNCGTVFGLSLLPPAILQPPQSQTAEAGATVRFSAHADGAQPLTYEWVFDDTNVLTDDTNALLRLTNVQSAQAGSYTVVVTNLFGAVTSSPAMLNVIPPVTRRLVPSIHLMAAAEGPLDLEYTDALGGAANWIPWTTVLPEAAEFYFDLTEPIQTQRFYRARQTTILTDPPSLALSMVPAITLTGTPGDKVRVDGINTIGPTDAWFPLAAVTLTNAAQLYFDTSAPGQPWRLYRLVSLP